MIITEKSILIHRTVEDVFEFHSDHANRMEWHDHTLASRKETPGPIGIGTVFAVTNQVGMRKIEMQIKITDFKPFGAYTYQTATSVSRSTSHQRFEPVPEGTRFSIRVENELSGVFGLLNPLFKFWFNRHAAAAVRELKETMENGRKENSR
jgi:hypothetical protein